MATRSAVPSVSRHGILRSASKLWPCPICIRHRRLSCTAVKEERPEGRLTASSRTSPRRTTSSRTTQQRPQQPADKPLQAKLGEYGKHVDRFLSNLAPKQEGDMMDVLLMSTSMAVLIYMSMQLYRVYAFAYYHVGDYQTLMDMTS